uniref:Uncharacterized protein n=1 Tax=Nelumbo nucifera TaxID=4432 RepID=A0A822ZIT7_NELNU|nr:TPA_asm: hypothetical protein HUJ06_003017 [Nelumbo nucifera]
MCIIADSISIRGGGGDLGAQLLKVQDDIPICASIISQRLALYSLEVGAEWVRDGVKDLAKNHGREGAIYLWEKLPQKYLDDFDVAVVHWLAHRYDIVVILGAPCGGPGYIRISFGGLPEVDCEVAAGRLCRGLEELMRDEMVQ